MNESFDVVVLEFYDLNNAAASPPTVAAASAGVERLTVDSE